MDFFKNWKPVHKFTTIFTVVAIIAIFGISMIQVVNYYSVPLETGEAEILISNSSETLHYAVGKESQELFYLILWLETPELSYQVDVMLETVVDLIRITRISHDINISNNGIKIMIPSISASKLYIEVYNSDALTYEQFLENEVLIEQYGPEKFSYQYYYEDNSEVIFTTWLGTDYIPSLEDFLISLISIIFLFGLFILLGIIGYRINPEEPEKWTEVPLFIWVPVAMFVSLPLIFLLNFMFFLVGTPILLFMLVGIGALGWILVNLGYFMRYVSNNAYYLQFLLAMFFGLYYNLVFVSQIFSGVGNLEALSSIGTFILFLLSPLLFLYSLNEIGLVYKEAWKRISLILISFFIPYLIFKFSSLVF